MKRTIIKRIIAIVLFVCILCGIHVRITSIVEPYELGIYSQKEDTIDVLILGSSLAGSNFDGQVLWDEFGISAYSMWGMDQPLWNSYYYLEEALKNQPPQLVVLECHSVFQQEPFLSPIERQAASITPLRMSVNKLDAIMHSSPFELWDDMLLKMPIYHDNITRLKKENYEKKESLNNKGFTATGTNIEVSHGRDHGVHECESVLPLYEKNEKYLRLIIEKCKDEDIGVLLVQSPSPEYDYYPYFNRVKEIAEEYDVRYVNYNLPETYIDIPDDEFYDFLHLNNKGSRRLAPHIAEEMKAVCHLEDHRGDNDYVSWDYNSATTNAYYLQSLTEYEDYIDELERDGFFVCFLDYERDGNATFQVRDFSDDKGEVLVGDAFDNFQYEYNGHVFTADMQNPCDVILRYDGEFIVNTEESARVMMVYDKYTDSIIDTVLYFNKDNKSGKLTR